METRVWHKVEDKQGAVLALTGDTLYRLGFTGKNAKREATEAVTALLAGADPSTIVSPEAKAVPLHTIKRVEVSHGRDAVKFIAEDGGKTFPVEFSVKSGDDAPGIARAAVERAAMEHPERSEDIGVVEALLGPVIIGVIAGVLWAFLYGAATAIDAGEDLPVNRGSARGRGFKKMIAFAAEMLGTNGTIAVGVLLLLAVVAWAVRVIVKRPQRMVWGPPAA